MREMIEEIDLVIDSLKNGDTGMAMLLLVGLKTRLLVKQENVKLARKHGAKKRELVDALKKLKL
jgi:hypothetical protein